MSGKTEMTMTPRRRLMAATLALPLATWARAQSGSAQDRPVRIIVPFAAGAGTDAVARLIGTLVDGLFKRRALEPDFDGEWAVAAVLAATRAALAGQIAFNPTSAAVRDDVLHAAHP